MQEPREGHLAQKNVRAKERDLGLRAAVPEKRQRHLPRDEGGRLRASHCMFPLRTTGANGLACTVARIHSIRRREALQPAVGLVFAALLGVECGDRRNDLQSANASRARTCTLHWVRATGVCARGTSGDLVDDRLVHPQFLESEMDDAEEVAAFREITGSAHRRLASTPQLKRMPLRRC